MDDTKPRSKYTFLNGKGNEVHKLGTDPSPHKRIISVVKKVELVSDRMLYVILRSL
jgi:hypothetical protein